MKFAILGPLDFYANFSANFSVWTEQFPAIFVETSFKNIAIIRKSWHISKAGYLQPRTWIEFHVVFLEFHHENFILFLIIFILIMKIIFPKMLFWATDTITYVLLWFTCTYIKMRGIVHWKTVHYKLLELGLVLRDVHSCLSDFLHSWLNMPPVKKATFISSFPTEYLLFPFLL